MYRDRLRMPALWGKVTTPEQAALLFRDGMVVGMSGFTRAGDAKEVPVALAERAGIDPLKITLLTGASLGNDIDRILSDAGVIARRMPFQVDTALRRHINQGEVMFIDQHLSETVEMLRSRQLGPIDLAVVEATAITEEGHIVPTTSVGNSASFAILAEKIIVEINLNHPLALEGLHDIYIPTYRPHRDPIPVMAANSRIGLPAIPIDPGKIAAIVVTEKYDSTARIEAPDAETSAIAGHLSDLFLHEVRKGRMGLGLQPIQSGIGAIANAVLTGFVESRFHGLSMYSEVLQDSCFELFEAGKLNFASGCSITVSGEWYERAILGIEKYKPRLIMRPQEISNHPEVIRRLGVLAINTALECDIYGNVNSTHVNGTHMMNGIGGSGDFARNAHMAIFVTKSLAKGGNISSIVPMVPHVDHNEHDVDIVVTECGLADLRGLAPRERAESIIRNCAHPSFRDALLDYYRSALKRGGQTPHLLEEAFAWHLRAQRTGSMRPEKLAAA
ncbi:succinate CoA transferase [Acetobacteraceae bacterium H6797]|nr:succinate CoA transferase [Acetobacteraceae bacterium H6797]